MNKEHSTHKTYLNWSSGKDAMLALHKLTADKFFSVEKLVTTLNTDFNRVSMHGLQKSLLETQAKSIGLPLEIIPLDGNISMETYNERMTKVTGNLKKDGFTHAVFGDILLEDLRTYRESQLEEVGIEAVFPLWQEDTTVLMEKLIELGYRAIVVCVNAKVLDKSFCGRVLDQSFLDDLPKNVDPCGENGEFHTFVFDGPLFSKPVKFELGEKVLRDYSPSDEDDCFTKEQSWDHKFWYQELEPSN